MLLRIEDSLHLLLGSKYFTKLDLKAGCWQVKLKEPDKQKRHSKLEILESMNAAILQCACNISETY